MRIHNMKTRLLLAVAALTLLASCNIEPPGPMEYWLSYDGIDIMSAPNDSAEVIGRLPGLTTPYEIERRDSSGEWGYHYNPGTITTKGDKGWLRLKDMVYAGSEDPSERLETYVVTTDNLPVYKHPKADKNDRNTTFHKGDTVLVTAKQGNWKHLFYTRFGKSTGRQREYYGWVETSQLQKIDSMTRDGVAERMLAKAVVADAKSDEEVEYLKSRQEKHTAYRHVGIVIGYMAWAVMLAFAFFAFRRKKGWDVLMLFVLGGLILGMSQTILVSSFWFALIIPLMAMVLCYPLLYFKTSRLFGFLYPVLSLIAAIYYIVYCSDVLHPTFWIVVWFLILVAAVVVETVFIRGKIVRSICTHCGYYAKHTLMDYRSDKRVTGHGEKTKREFVKTTTTKTGEKTIITDHYNVTKVKEEHISVHTEADYECVNCGQLFTVRRDFSYTREV